MYTVLSLHVDVIGELVSSGDADALRFIGSISASAAAAAAAAGADWGLGIMLLHQASMCRGC